MITKITFWCQKVLPIEFDDSLSYYETLCKVVEKLNETISTTNNAFNQLETDVNTELNKKQDTLVSGENIKTVNGQSILGSGNVEIDTGIDVEGNPTGNATDGDLAKIKIGSKIFKIHDYTDAINGKLDKKTNISTYDQVYVKTAKGVQIMINATPYSISNSIIWRGSNGRSKISTPEEDLDIANKTYVDSAIGGKQDTLISGQNIKTVNGESILGSGNIIIEGGLTPSISATASVNNNTGTPAVTVTKSGTDASPSFDFAFQNLKGNKGDTGESGVYVGSTEPTDPGQNVWIDPNGEADYDGQFELIEEITLTEDVASIVREAEPDGTPYNLKNVRVVFINDGVITEKIALALGINSTTSSYTDISNVIRGTITTSTTNKWFTVVSADLEHGRITGSLMQVKDNIIESPNSVAKLVSSQFIESNSIDSIRIASYTASGYSLMKTGLKIKIYGVRS